MGKQFVVFVAFGIGAGFAGMACGGALSGFGGLAFLAFFGTSHRSRRIGNFARLRLVGSVSSLRAAVLRL